MPERRTCLANQRSTELPRFGGWRFASLAGVELGQRSKLCFERPPESAKRRRLLLGEFVLKQICECGAGIAVEHRSIRARGGVSFTADHPSVEHKSRRGGSLEGAPRIGSYGRGCGRRGWPPRRGGSKGQRGNCERASR